ncbi:twin-arginine translocase TatA/TatE family subunit [Mucilaginibacter sp.]|uniref:Sec-independent protein translocase subunit TatA/TatB n=1 Tax=Mucilaginibacter sp. TaxID=1882438 RepID=UPI0026172719|nr:twin-arginine translocase TatA/TatE family subunit [Mucilaginibacter sp.]MDB4925737.1 twin-arginine translocase TatA/TatE family subunit [Mucilaginibacter sp.]
MFSSVFLFFEFSAPEIMLILFVTLLLFGGDKLPGLAKGLGKGIREFKDASEGVKREINNQIDNYENKKKEEPAAPAVEETPLVAEHSTDNIDNAAPDSHVVNTMPVGESQVTGTDKVAIETPAKEHHTGETQIPEHENTKHE